MTAAAALALPTNRTHRPMPTTEPPQSNLLTALVAGAFGAFGAAMVYAGNRYQAYLASKTAIKVKEIDSDDSRRDELREDVRTLKVELKDAVTQIDALRKEGVDLAQKVGHLVLENEKLVYQIAKLEEQKSETRAEYEAQIATRDARIAQQDMLIAELQRQIADFEHIGVGETAPPKRQKEG